WVLVIACVFTGSTHLPAAEDGKPAGKKKTQKTDSEAVADAKTAALLDKIDALTYSLGAEGVKKASCEGEVTMQIPGQPRVKRQFRYLWDGNARNRKGKVTYAEAEGQAAACNSRSPTSSTSNSRTCRGGRNSPGARSPPRRKGVRPPSASRRAPT